MCTNSPARNKPFRLLIIEAGKVHYCHCEALRRYTDGVRKKHMRILRREECVFLSSGVQLPLLSFRAKSRNPADDCTNSSVRDRISPLRDAAHHFAPKKHTFLFAAGWQPLNERSE